MRLTHSEINQIKETVHKLDAEARIYLFGSRVNDNLYGGDIDLLILSDKLGLHEKLILRYLLKEKLGNRKIDLLLTPKPDNAFAKHALKNGLPI